MIKYLRKNWFLSYIILFFIIFIIGTLPIQIKNKTFLFSGLYAGRDSTYDALKQHILFMYDFVGNAKEAILKGNLMDIYRFDLGMGGDIFASYTYYSMFDPLMIIALILPLSYIELSYYIILVTRIFLSGLFMILYLKKMNIKSTKALVYSGVTYAFSLTLLFSAFRHPMFTNGPMYLPLLLIGVEQLKEKRFPILLIVVTFLHVISQYYIFIYTAFGVFIYLIFKYNPYRNLANLRLILKTIGFMFIGFFIAGFVFVPQIVAVLGGSRVANKGFNWFDLCVIFGAVLSQILPLMGRNYSGGIGNLVLYLVVAGFMSVKKSNLNYLKYFFITCFALMLIPLFGLIINIGSYSNNRWSYIMMVPTIHILALFLEGELTLKDINARILTKYFWGIIISLPFIGVIILVNYHTYLLIVFKIIITLALVTLLIFCIYHFVYKKVLVVPSVVRVFKRVKLQYFAIASVLFTFLFTSIYYQSFLTPANAFNTYYPERDKYKDIFNDNDFYRVEQNTFSGNVNAFSNDNLAYGYNSTYQYNTLASGDVNNLMKNLEVVNINNSVGYNGFDFRSRLLILNQVRYVIIRESEKKLPPYGFVYKTSVEVEKYNDKIIQAWNGNIDGTEKAHIYENTNFTGLGHFQKDVISLDEFSLLSPLQKEEALLDYLVLDEPSDLVPNYEQINETNIVLDIEDGLIEVDDEEKPPLNFTVSDIEDCELYVKIKLNSTREREFSGTMKTTAVTNRFNYYPYGSNFYVDNDEYLLNMGYYESAKNLEVSLFLDKGDYEVDLLSYYLLPTDTIKTKTDTLNNTVLQEYQKTYNGFSGFLNAPDDGYSVFSIPYSKGFSAYVNNKEVSVQQANIGMMAIKVSKGENQIKFVYTVPGLRLGMYLSGFGLLSFTVLGGYYIIKNKKQNSSIDPIISN